MVKCPHCNENGIGFIPKLWSGSSCPTTCSRCGNLSYLRTSLMHWAGASLQLFGLIAILASFMLEHWWPIAAFVATVIFVYIFIGLLASMEPISNEQATENKRYGNIFLIVIIVFALIAAFIAK